MSDNINDTIHSLGNAFEEFKTANDERLKQIESKGASDPLTEAKVDAINATVTELQKKMQRPNMGAGEANAAEVEHKNAFEKWARKGTGENELESIEKKAITLGTGGDASGGFLVPRQVEAGIRNDLRTLSPIRSRATVVSTVSDNYSFLRNARGLQVGWVGEVDARPETATPTLTETRVPGGEIYANPPVSQRALDDAGFDLEAWLNQNIAEEFAIEENKQFLIGDGVNKPKGILTTTGIKTLKSGAAAAMPTGSDYILDMIYGLKAAYRNGAAFLGNGATIAGLRKLKDTTGNYMFQPSLVLGTPSTLMGYELLEVEDMPDVAANAMPLAFGNLKQGYLIADRLGIRTLRDPYSHKPFVTFYATKRVSGIVQDLNAFIVMQNKV
ncbi:phage major capsid protein [Sphingomonas sp. NFX23]|uniref:phage major capsid protein n=1 Tax=Sphingomonas sp. NFX23 TaxID=2819532 RepID=UPI003CF5024C